MKLTKKMIIAGAGVVGAVGIGSAAFAFFNAGGSGSGAAIVNATVQGVTLTGSSTAALVPAEPRDIDIVAANPNSASARIGKVSITNAKVVGTPAQVALCPITVVGTDPATEHTVPGNDSIDLNGLFSLTLEDSATEDQTACLSLPVSYTITAAAPLP